MNYCLRGLSKIFMPLDMKTLISYLLLHVIWHKSQSWSILHVRFFGRPKNHFCSTDEGWFIFLQGTYLIMFMDFAIRSTTWMALIGILRSVGDISGVSKKLKPKDSVIQYSMALIMERDIQSEFCQALLFFLRINWTIIWIPTEVQLFSLKEVTLPLSAFVSWWAKGTFVDSNIYRPCRVNAFKWKSVHLF